MPTVTNHGPVTLSLIACIVVALVIALAKKYGLDVTELQFYLQSLAVSAGYLAKAKEGA